MIAALALGCVRSVPTADSSEGAPSEPAKVDSEPSDPEPSEGEGEPALVVTNENSATQLLEQAANIERVELVKLDSRFRLGSFDTVALARLREGLAAGSVQPDLTNTPPRWDVALEIHVSDRAEYFVAHPVGEGRLRLNPIEPWSPMIVDPATQQLDPRIRELDVGEPVLEAIEALIGDRVEPSKEHQPHPKHDMSKYRVDPKQ